MIPQHSAQREDHITPSDIIERARRLMGSIKYDPASSSTANTIVRADRFDTEGALERRWQTKTLWLNPPGGALRLVDGRWQESTIKVEGKLPKGDPKRVAHSKAALYWSKLVASWQCSDVGQAVFLGFTLEILRTSSAYGLPPVQAFPFCVPSSRIPFLDPVTLKPQRQPAHSNVVAWLPPKKTLGSPTDQNAVREVFSDLFSDLGHCTCPRWSA